MLSKKIITIGCVAIIVFQFACKDGGVQPPPPPKDPRTYAFTVDTIAYLDAGQTNLYDIAGTSTNNVYAVGYNSSYSAGTMFRYDGTSWKTTGFHMTQGGPISGAIDFFSLQAFSSNDVWFVGSRTRLNPTPPPNFIDSSFILHYNGTAFTEYKASGARELLSIHGIAPNDIWACGFSGTLLHYNGVQWARDSVPISVPSNGGIILRGIRAVSAQTVYLIGFGFVVENNVDRTTYNYFFHRSGNRWAVIDSMGPSENRWGDIDLWTSPSGVLYSLGSFGVWRWSGMQWIKILNWSGGPLQSIWGHSDDNFFVGGYRTLLHYNGTDFYQYPTVTSDMVYEGIWGSGNELFVVGNDGSKSYVFHGR